LVVKKLIVFAGMVVLVCGVIGCGRNADSLIKEEIKNMNAMADAMEKKDDAKLKDCQTKLEETNKKLQALKLSDQEKKQLLERHQDELQKATMRVVQASMSRMGDLGKMFGGKFPGMPGGQMPNMPPMPAAPGSQKNP
jgi:hypothetical protein